MSADASLIAAGLAAGTVRIATPLLLAAAGDCLVQRTGRLNLGLEGIIPCAAVAAVYASASGAGPWAGLAAAMAAGAALAALHWLCCLLPRVDDLAAGIALLVLGIGIARFVGAGLAAAAPEPLPQAALGPIAIGVLLPAGLAAAALLSWMIHSTRTGLQLTAVGLDAEAAQLSGARPQLLRLAAAVAGGMGGGAAGAALGLWYPLGWSDHLGAGIGITAIALAFLARAEPLLAAAAALIFAAAAALGPAIQATGDTGGYHLLNAVPYILALLLLAAAARDRGWGR